MVDSRKSDAPDLPTPRHALSPHLGALPALQLPDLCRGSLGGEYVRKSLDLTSWEAASDVITGWTASGTIGVVRAEIPSIADAVKKFFEDAARQLKPATIGKHTGLAWMQAMQRATTSNLYRGDSKALAESLDRIQRTACAILGAVEGGVAPRAVSTFSIGR